MTDQPTPAHAAEPYVEWTDAELDSLSTVNAVTLADARADALRLPDIAALLEAEEGEE